MEYGFSLARLDGQHLDSLDPNSGICEGGYHVEPSANGYRLSPGASYKMSWDATHSSDGCHSAPLTAGRYRIVYHVTNRYPCTAPDEPQKDGSFYCSSCDGISLRYFDLGLSEQLDDLQGRFRFDARTRPGGRVGDPLAPGSASPLDLLLDKSRPPPKAARPDKSISRALVQKKQRALISGRRRGFSFLSQPNRRCGTRAR
jgi:hypothetical protein